MVARDPITRARVGGVMSDSLEQELVRLEARLPEGQAPVIEELARVRGDLSRCAPFDLASLRIASPCKERWADMTGDDRVRVCNGCERPVFDLTELTRAEAEAVLATRGITPCVRLRRRADGTVITADCAPAPRRQLAVMAGAIAAGAALMTASSAGADPLGVTFTAETTGALQGVIVDAATGEPLIGATVVASSPSLPGLQTAITDESGAYQLADLPQGTYVLDIYYLETTQQRAGVEVAVGERAVANVSFSVATPGQVIGIDQVEMGLPLDDSYITMGIPVGRTFDEVDHRPAIEWSSWVRVGYGTEAAEASPGVARLVQPQAPERHGAWEAALGADVSVPLARGGEVRLGAWTEVRTSSLPVVGAELLVQGLPEHLDLFAFDGEGLLALRVGTNARVATAAVAYGYLAPWNLFGPWRGATRYMIGARLVVSANQSLEDPDDWSVTGGVELEPVGALRYLLGIRSWYR